MSDRDPSASAIPGPVLDALRETVLGGEVVLILCSAEAAACRCSKPDGHVEAGDDVHECDPTRCTGAWTGEYEAGTFMVMRLPFPVSEPRPWDIP